MAVLQTISVNVVANATKFTQGLRKAGDSTRKFGRQVQSTAQNKLKALDDRLKKVTASTKLFTAGLAVLGVGGIVSGFTSTAQAMDQLNQRAQRLGVGAQRLRELSFAAEQTGVDFNQLATAMQRAARRIAQATTGSGEAVGVLKQLNLSAEQLNRMNPADQLLVLADALSKVTNQNDKIAAMFKLFDTEGVGLINLFEGGSGKMRAFSEEFRNFAGVLHEQDFDRMREMNKQLSIMRELISAEAQNITIELAPTVTELLKGLGWLTGTLREAGETMGNWVGTAWNSTPQDFADLATFRAAAQASNARRRQFPEGFGGRQKEPSARPAPPRSRPRASTVPFSAMRRPDVTYSPNKQLESAQYQQAQDMKRAREVLERILDATKGNRFSLD